jgi:hypothetical protein
VRTNRGDTFELRLALALAENDPKRPQPKCVERFDLYVDYDKPPNEEEAKELCSGCPLLDICRRSALADKPAWGVKGGIAWDEGKQRHWLEKLGHTA